MHWATNTIQYHSFNIVRMIKSRRLRWAGHVAKMEEVRGAFKILTVATIRERLSLKKGIKQHLVADRYNLSKLVDRETRKEYQIDC